MSGALTLTSGTWNAGAGLTHRINGSWDSTAITFNRQTGTIDLTGTGNIVNPETFYNLTKSTGGTIVLQAPITVEQNLTFSGGTFNANGQIIRLRGDFDRSAGGSFLHGGGTVRLYDSSVDSYVRGNNSFYNFVCDVVDEPDLVQGDIGKTIYFEANNIQTIIAGGSFRIRGTNTEPPLPDLPYTTSYISLHSTTDLVGNEWTLRIQIGANLITSFTDVWYSVAVPPYIVPGDTSIHNCIDWLKQNRVLGSYTRDTDGNGKIDIIEVVVEADLDDTTFLVAPYLQVSVSGYTVKQITRGSEASDNDRTIWIELDEKPYLDTGVQPKWYIVNSGSLRDIITHQYQVVHQTDIDSSNPEIPYDDADPVVAYTLAVAGRNEVFVRFSEPVAVGALSYAGSATVGGYVVDPRGVGALDEMLITASGNITAAEVFANTFMNFTGFDDNAPNPPAVVPVWADLPAGFNPLQRTPHRVSDVGLGLAGAGLIEPFFAFDQTLVDGSGMGRIYTVSGDRFDGCRWLRDQDLTVQANIHPDIAAPGITALSYDVNVPAASMPRRALAADLRRNGVQRDRPAARPRAPVRWPPPIRPASAATTPPSRPPTRRSATGPRWSSSSASSPPDLYCARVIDPTAADWYRQVRPWAFDIHDLRLQAGGVNILSNVINPTRGETVKLQYFVSKAGMVTIQVFDLAGGHRGRAVPRAQGGQHRGRLLHHLGRPQPRRAGRGPRGVLHQGGGSRDERDPQGAGGEVGGG